MRLGYLMPLTVDAIATARKLGYDSLEAKVGWLGSRLMDDIESHISSLKEAMAEHNVAITAIAIYGSAVQTPVGDTVDYYCRAMDAALALGCGVVAGMTGRDGSLTMEDNLPLFKERFDTIARMAGDRGLRIAFEPWPGQVTGYGPYRWANMAIAPELYDRIFEAVPHAALGIEYDASHYYWQSIDYMQLWRDYSERIYHVHAKDITVDLPKLKRVGVHGPDWWRFTIPGLGEIDWPSLIGMIKDSGYTGDLVVEHEDSMYMGPLWNEGLSIAYATLRPLV